jgi:hypothetical protein
MPDAAAIEPDARPDVRICGTNNFRLNALSSTEGSSASSSAGGWLETCRAAYLALLGARFLPPRSFLLPSSEIRIISIIRGKNLAKV